MPDQRPEGEASPYRYELWRRWSSGPTVAFVLLNPSTATAATDDPTIRRCIGYAKRWGYGRLQVVNLFALRSTDPRALYRTEDPVGPENDAAIYRVARGADLVVCAWGVHGWYRSRDIDVLELLRSVPLHALRVTKDGAPAHPLYLPGALEPREWWG